MENQIKKTKETPDHKKSVGKGKRVVHKKELKYQDKINKSLQVKRNSIPLHTIKFITYEPN